MPPSDDRIRQTVCDLLNRAEFPLTPQRIERIVSEELGIPKRSVRGAIRSLVEGGRFSYAPRNGTVYLERSFSRPVRISDRIWLCPPGAMSLKNLPPDAVLIRIRPGAAFGIGDHPTTRLALRGIEGVMVRERPETALDIGAGTGVLAIAAALLGARRILALDVDGCARAETAANAAENGVAERIDIQDLPMDRVPGAYSLVCANLRPPTLSRLALQINRFSKYGAAAVFSGFRPEEWPPLAEDYRTAGWHCVWQDTERHWMAVVCRNLGAAGAAGDR